jgi:hypothetical protein
VGGSLRKNMVKAGGPKDWYIGHVDGKGEWHYTILPELINRSSALSVVVQIR